jgi:hypothetical protein
MQPAPARRRSIFGGLLLTLLGTYFLLANLLPELNLWSAFWRYWPALLILWGVARLVDYRSARRAGQAPPRTLTAGEFVLVLLLIGRSAPIRIGRSTWCFPGIGPFPFPKK